MESFVTSSVTKRKLNEEDVSESKQITVVAASKKQKVVDTSLILFKSKTQNGYSFLSNFWPYVPDAAKQVCKLPLEAEKIEFKLEFGVFKEYGFTYHSSEEFYQAQKFWHILPSYRPHLCQDPDAKEIKKRSGKGYWVDYVTTHTKLFVSKQQAKLHFDKKLKEFLGYSVDVMLLALLLKFSSNQALKKALLATGQRKLSEQGRMKKDFWAHTGSDALGRLLIQVRSLLNQGDENLVTQEIQQLIEKLNNKLERKVI